MADDITLTVRVRDMTRGEFNQIRQRMRGMDGDIRRMSNANNAAGQSAERLSRNLRGVQGRLGQLQRTGRLARSEMDYMRRSMGLLDRDMRMAARNGELTEEQFGDLRRELERTRLDFDHLDNGIRRHNAVTQAAHRAEAARLREQERLRREAARTAARLQREAERLRREERRRQEADARAIVADRQRMARAHAAGLREEAQRNLAAQRAADQLRREERRRQEGLARSIVAARQRMARAHAAALREEGQRDREARRRQEALARSIISERQRIARAHAAALREEAQRNQRAEAERQRAARAATQAQQREVARLAGLGGRDAGRTVTPRVRRIRQDNQRLTLRFRALGEDDMNRMTRGFASLQRSMDGVTGSSDRTRRSVRALGGDLRTMARALQDAQNAGSLSRREFDAMSRGLQMTVRDARLLRRAGDLTGSSFRDMRREVAGLRAQLRLLGREGNVLQRLGDHTILLQRRLRDTREHVGGVRRALSRIGEGGLGGINLITRSLGGITAAAGRLRERLSNASRGMKIFLLVLGLLGPLAPVVGALLTTVLGGAFIALGAFALRSEKQVKNAFTHMKSSIAVTARSAAQPLKAALVVGMHEVAEATQEMGGALTEAFAGAAPLVSDFAGAFTDLASGALPGVVESLREMGPVMEGFRSAMGTIGEGLGEMFAAMTSDGGAQGLKDTWQILGDGIKNVLVNIGEFINAMSQSETATTLLSTAFGVLSSILVVIEAIFAAIDAVLGPLLSKMQELGLTTGLIGLLAKGFEALGVSTVDVDAKTSEFAESLKGTAASQNEAAVKTLSHAQALKTLNDQIKIHNDQNLNRFEAEASMNQAAQDTLKNAENLGKTIKINNGIFDTTHENTRKVAQDFYKLAGSTQRAVDAAIEAKAPLEEQNRLWKQGESDIRALGKAYGIPKKELNAFIALVLKTPKKAKTELEVEAEEAKQKAVDLLKKVKEADGFKAKMRASLEAAAAVREAGRIAALLNGLNGRFTSSKHIHTTVWKEVHQRVDASASPDFRANGGVIRRALGGRVLGFPGGGSVSGPGTSMSDSIPARLSDGEFVVRARAVRRYGTAMLNAINQGRFNPLRMAMGGHVARFAKGGVSKKEKEARKEAAGDLTISAAGRMAGRKNTEFANALGDPGSIGELISSINKWRSIIKKATHGGVEKSLLGSLTKAGKSLLKYQAQQDKVTRTLEKAKAVRDAVKNSVLTSTQITEGAAGDRTLTMGKLMSRMTQNRDKATAFASALRDLRKKGVSKDIIKQVADAGIDGGGLETAGALLRASGSEIKSLNRMQDQIKKAAVKAGNATADAMYGAGMKAGEGIIAGLEKQQKNIEKAMMKIAKSMEKAIKRALGIKSPSKVMEQVGEYTAEGFAVGVRKNNGTSDALTSMLSVTPSASGSSHGGMPGGQQVIQVIVGGRVLDEIILDSNRRTVRTRGGNVQAVYGATRR